MIQVKIVEDSLAPNESRLTTFVLTYPRFIHSEFMTHRVFSRNASSSRATPVKKQIQMIIDNPAIPLAFTKNKPGMQGGEVLDEQAHENAMLVWLNARDSAVNYAKILADLEVHKQYANRILEPWAHITVVCTATDFNNFFALRYHPAAQPEICELAKQMWELYTNNTPKPLLDGEWHLPFCDEFDKKNDSIKMSIVKSVARCARVSYLNHDGAISTYEQDLQLYDRLLGSFPIHASPSEHQAMAISDANVRSGNFYGWIQYRKTLKNENVNKFTRSGE